jgi:hypothetical protein
MRIRQDHSRAAPPQTDHFDARIGTVIDDDKIDFSYIETLFSDTGRNQDVIVILAKFVNNL